MRKPRIGIIHPCLGGLGGSELTAFWIAEALKNDYEVSLITMGDVNLNLHNNYFGTDLRGDEVKIVILPCPILFRKQFAALRGYHLSRYCKKVSGDFDLMISGYNVMDFGRPGIQYISDFSFDDKLRQEFHPVQQGLKKILYTISPFRKFYLALSLWLSTSSPEWWARNWTIVNSQWSGQVIKLHYGWDAEVIYPPVVTRMAPQSFEKREEGFLVIGRISPEKRIENVIAVLDKVRDRGYPIHLHILGRIDATAYVKMLRRIAKDKPWVHFEGLAVGDVKEKMMNDYKYGISGCKNEAFGIGTAEMVQLGCIVWAPEEGGQGEILRHPLLIYKGIDDAVNKIISVLGSPARQASCRRQLAANRRKFNEKRFVKEIRDTVRMKLNEVCR